jgi:GTP-binding protein
VVVNKVDKPNCNPEETNELVFELMFALDATEEQLEYPTVYGSSKQGWMGPDWRTPTEDMAHLLDTIVEYFDAPAENPGTLQLQISSLDYSSYTGRIAVGKIHRGTIKMGDQVSIVQRNGLNHKSTVKELYTFEGLGKEKTKKGMEGRVKLWPCWDWKILISGIPLPIMSIPRPCLPFPSMSLP